MSTLREGARRYFAVPLVMGALITTASAQSQGRGDTIGDLIRTSTFSSADHVNVGKSDMIRQACFFREQGSGHMLDIGVSADSAFIRLAYGDGPLPAGSVPKPPLQMFAGKELTKVIDGDMKVTGEYEPIQIFDGTVNYTPNIATRYGSGFIVVTEGDARPFLKIIARARGEFIAVRSASEPEKIDVVAIYDFKETTMSALLSCAKRLSD